MRHDVGLGLFVTLYHPVILYHPSYILCSTLYTVGAGEKKKKTQTTLSQGSLYLGEKGHDPYNTKPSDNKAAQERTNTKNSGNKHTRTDTHIQQYSYDM